MHRRSVLARVVVLLTLLAPPVSARAESITLDFEEQHASICFPIGDTLDSQGVRFTKTDPQGDFFACDASPTLGISNNTSRAIIDGNSASPFDMVLIGGGVFDLVSLDAGPEFSRIGIYAGVPASTGIRLTGFLAAGGSIAIDLMFDGAKFETFGLAGFDGLTRVSWRGLNDSPIGFTQRFLFDNVALEILAVPEPASLALLGLGLASLGHARRRAGSHLEDPHLAQPKWLSHGSRICAFGPSPRRERAARSVAAASFRNAGIGPARSWSTASTRTARVTPFRRKFAIDPRGERW